MSANPNLQKIIKLTQAQYDILAAGGTVGDYTGLNDNYLYLIQDTTEYITEEDLTEAINGVSQFYYTILS